MHAQRTPSCPAVLYNQAYPLLSSPSVQCSYISASISLSLLPCVTRISPSLYQYHLPSSLVPPSFEACVNSIGYCYVTVKLYPQCHVSMGLSDRLTIPPPHTHTHTQTSGSHMGKKKIKIQNRAPREEDVCVENTQIMFHTQIIASFK